jgi:hypothetical protein
MLAVKLNLFYIVLIQDAGISFNCWHFNMENSCRDWQQLDKNLHLHDFHYFSLILASRSRYGYNVKTTYILCNDCRLLMPRYLSYCIWILKQKLEYYLTCLQQQLVYVITVSVLSPREHKVKIKNIVSVTNHVMKAYGWHGGKAPQLFNLVSRWRWAFSLLIRPVHPRSP